MKGSPPILCNLFTGSPWFLEAGRQGFPEGHGLRLWLIATQARAGDMTSPARFSFGQFRTDDNLEATPSS